MLSPTMPQASEASLIKVKLSNVSQLFNSMDPSPFHERDLDHDAEEFIVSWALEHPAHTPLKLVVQITQATEEQISQSATLVRKSVHNYFEYSADMKHREMKQLLKEGRTALAIGLTFLAICEVLAGMIPGHITAWHAAVQEGLTILGWVAMWEPLNIFLYSWWPLLRRERVLRKLSRMEVEVTKAL